MPLLILAAHRFFIPDVEYLVDPEGLVGYVEEKVKLGNICIYCNGKGKTFHTCRSLQQVCETLNSPVAVAIFFAMVVNPPLYRTFGLLRLFLPNSRLCNSFNFFHITLV